MKHRAKRPILTIWIYPDPPLIAAGALGAHRATSKLIRQRELHHTATTCPTTPIPRLLTAGIGTSLQIAYESDRSASVSPFVNRNTESSQGASLLTTNGTNTARRKQRSWGGFVRYRTVRTASDSYTVAATQVWRTVAEGGRRNVP